MIKKITTIITLFILFCIFKKYSLISKSIIYSCNLFLYNIFPSLFPMFIISSLLMNLNFIEYINIFFKKFNRVIFKINSNESYILFISLISGCPSNAKTAKEMYDNKMIDKINIQKILLFSHFSNPLFIIAMIKHKTILVLISHYISNFIIGIITRNLYISDNYYNNKNVITNKKVSVILFESISNALSTLLFILGTIVTFYIITTIINIPFFNIILELSQGINYLSSMNIDLKLKTICLGSLLSFGGICIHFQVYGILNELKLKYIPYLLSRIFQSLITALIIYIFY